MITTIYNVGHGETINIRIKKNNQTIIRDFGRSRFAKHTDFSCSLARLIYCSSCFRFLYDASSVNNTDAVLSHAHEDHFNGFEMLYKLKYKNIFDNAYIPYLSKDDFNSLGGILIKYSLFLFRYYGSKNIIAANAKHWLLAAPIMATISKNLWCVTAGYQVSHWGKSNKILWPLAVPEDYVSKLEKQWNKYLEDNDESVEFLNNEAEEIRKLLMPFYSTKNDGLEFNSDTTASVINRIESILDRSFNIDQKFSSPSRLNTYAYKYTIDNHSLIFEIGDTGNEQLFLSDADDKTTNLMLNYNKIKNKNYNMIKAGHHGNRGAKALVKNGITGNSVVNSCGPAKSDWKGPDIEYKKVSEKLFCTDWNNSSAKWIQATKIKYIIPNRCFIRIP